MQIFQVISRGGRGQGKERKDIKYVQECERDKTRICTKVKRMDRIAKDNVQ